MAFVVIGVSGSPKGNAHINLATGSTNEVRPDFRPEVAVDLKMTSGLKDAADRAGCELLLHLRDEGHKHLPPSAPTPDYRTSPPNSGNHFESPYQQADGAYAESPPQAAVVHSLEHGRLAIEYRPTLPEDEQRELLGLYRSMWAGTLIFPYSDMSSEIAAVTWTNLLLCNQYRGTLTLEAIRAFGEKTWGRYGGEPVDGFALRGPTP